MVTQDTTPSTRRALGIGLLLLLTWLAVNGVWGLTSARDTLVSGLERQVAPLAAWVAVPALALFVVAVLAGRRRDRGLLAISAMLLAYLLGVVFARYAKLAIDPTGGIPLRGLADGVRALVERSFILLPALPMLGVGLFFHREELPLRFGDWGVETGGGSGPGSGTWGRSMIWALVLVGLPCFLLLQSTVGFAPIRTGSLWPALVPVILLALFNAFSEELLFRGLIQTPLVEDLGVRPGMILQAAFFAIHHWGASPSIAGGAPLALLLFFAAYWMGLAVVATRGLGWAIAFHAILDFTFFSAQFVPTS